MKFARLLYGYTFREDEPGSEGTPPATPPVVPPKTETVTPPKTEDPPEPKIVEVIPEDIKNRLAAYEKAEKEREDQAEADRLAKLETEERLGEELKAARETAAKAERKALLLEKEVPSVLHKLMPTENLAEYLDSEEYKQLAESIKPPSVQPPTTENEPPKAPPKASGKPVTKPQTFETLKGGGFAEFGKSILGI